MVDFDQGAGHIVCSGLMAPLKFRVFDPVSTEKNETHGYNPQAPN
jgi:hypothetical protein